MLTGNTPNVMISNSEWEPNRNADYDGMFHASFFLNGTLLHLHAVEVSMDTGKQSAVNPNLEQYIDALYNLTAASDVHETTTVQGRECVVWAEPSC